MVFETLENAIQFCQFEMKTLYIYECEVQNSKKALQIGQLNLSEKVLDNFYSCHYFVKSAPKGTILADSVRLLNYICTVEN